MPVTPNLAHISCWFSISHWIFNRKLGHAPSKILPHPSSLFLFAKSGDSDTLLPCSLPQLRWAERKRVSEGKEESLLGYIQSEDNHSLPTVPGICTYLKRLVARLTTPAIQNWIRETQSRRKASEAEHLCTPLTEPPYPSESEESQHVGRNTSSTNHLACTGMQHENK